MGEATVRVLTCEDSRAYAAALRRMLEHEGDITVAAVCGSAEEAIAVLPRARPDLVTMDMELPGMDGLRATEEIMSSRPLPILVLLTTVTGRREKAAAALAAGALDALAKDDLDLLDPAGAGGAAFRQHVRMLSRAHVIRHPRARLQRAPGLPGARRRASVIGICASTGGPQVLARVIEALPAGYQIPVLVVQHIAEGFTGGLAGWLDRPGRLPVAVAADGARAGPGVWIAPEGAHLVLSGDGRLNLDRHTVSGHYRPAGDVLLASIAGVAGKAAVGVVLSGMGSDGARGAAALRRGGGLVIAQDRESAAINGMPEAAIASGVDAVLSPEQIADCLLGLVHKPLGSAR